MTPDLPPVLPGHLPPFPPSPEGFSHWEYRGMGYDSTIPCVYAGFFEQYPEDGWRGIPDAPETLRGNVDAHYIEAIPIARSNGIGVESSGNSGEVESPKPEERYSPEVRQAAYDAANQEDGDHWGVLDAAKPPDIAMADFIEIVLGIKKPTPPKPEGETPLTDGEIHYRVGREDGWNEIVRANFARQLESDLAAARADSDGWRTKFLTQRDEANIKTWIWMGDGEDHPESLACPVIMSADQLREFVAAKESNERLRAALEPFAKEAPEWKIYEDGEHLVESFPQVDSQITVGDLRRALAALAPASSGKGEANG